MVSIIMNSTTEQWIIIFDIFARQARKPMYSTPNETLFVKTMLCRGVNGATPAKLYVVTSDAEKAIRSGLALSTLRQMSLHFICSLHAKWSEYNIRCNMFSIEFECKRWSCHVIADVSAHKIQGKRTFGKEAAERWSKLMQWAEGLRVLASPRVCLCHLLCTCSCSGPNAFLAGYGKMCELYSGDEARLKYIHELSADSDKHHFNKEYRFSNGCLTDVSEGLICATKHWVYGPSKNSPTLFMAVVRIVDGCNAMANRKFLEPRAKTKRSVKHQSPPVEYVCTCFLDSFLTDYI